MEFAKAGQAHRNVNVYRTNKLSKLNGETKSIKVCKYTSGIYGQHVLRDLVVGVKWV